MAILAINFVGCQHLFTRILIYRKWGIDFTSNFMHGTFSYYYM